MSQTRENFNSTNLSYIGPISKYFITQKHVSLNFYDETERKANHLQNHLYQDKDSKQYPNPNIKREILIKKKIRTNTKYQKHHKCQREKRKFCFTLYTLAALNVAHTT